jgi:hypothetical protein
MPPWTVPVPESASIPSTSRAQTPIEAKPHTLQRTTSQQATRSHATDSSTSASRTSSFTPSMDHANPSGHTHPPVSSAPPLSVNQSDPSSTTTFAFSQRTAHAPEGQRQVRYAKAADFEPHIVATYVNPPVVSVVYNFYELSTPLSNFSCLGRPIPQKASETQDATHC